MWNRCATTAEKRWLSGTMPSLTPLQVSRIPEPHMQSAMPIVRGTQLRETTEFLYQSGAREVHIRPACPPLIYGCKYLNFSRSTSDMDLITRRVISRLEKTSDVPNDVLQEYADPNSEKYRIMVEEIRKELNFTSLQYNRLDDLIESVGIEPCKLCTYCWNGKE